MLDSGRPDPLRPRADVSQTQGQTSVAVRRAHCFTLLAHNVQGNRSARLHIVHVVFSPHIAGGEQHCLDLAAAQAEAGHQVHIVGSARSAMREAAASSIQYHPLSLPLLRGQRLRSLMGRLGAQVCHAHLGAACRALAPCRDLPRVATLHAGYKPQIHGRLDGLICVNRDQWESLGTFGGVSRVIHNWAPQRPVRLPNHDLRQELGLAPGQVLVGAVGQLHPRKGLDVLVEAFTRYAPRNGVLALLGDGPQLPELKRLAGSDERIRFLGFRHDVDAALQSLDLFVSPSREAACPLSVLEAMRAELPIICTATSGLKEMLVGEAAAIVPVGNPMALGVAIRNHICHLGERRQVLRQRVRYDLSRYSRAGSVARVEVLYRELIARHAQLRRA